MDACRLHLTGASGSIFGQRLLQVLENDPRVSHVNFIASESSLRVIAEELQLSGRSELIAKLLGKASTKIQQLSESDIGAGPANPLPSTPARAPNRLLKTPGATGVLNTLTKISREPANTNFRQVNPRQDVTEKSQPYNFKIIERFKKGERGVNQDAVRRVTAWGMKTADLANSLLAVKAMEDAHIEPGLGIYNDLMSACLKGEQVYDALEVFSRMRKAGVLPDVSAFNVLIEACSDSGMFKKAFDIVEVMRQAGIEPDALIHDTLLAASDRSRVAD